MAVTLSSCLITQPVHFDEPPNSPPAIDTDGVATFPLNQIVQLGPMTGDGGSASLPTSAHFDFNVYDADVDQTLQFKVFIDGSQTPSTERTIPISSAMTGRDRRQSSFDVDLLPFGTGAATCHRVDLVVSSSFVFGSPRTPAIDHDIATATWWIRWDPTGLGSVDLSMCP